MIPCKRARTTWPRVFYDHSICFQYRPLRTQVVPLGHPTAIDRRFPSQKTKDASTHETPTFPPTNMQTTPSQQASGEFDPLFATSPSIEHSRTISPSSALKQALGAVGKSHLINDTYPHKMDLSYMNVVAKQREAVRAHLQDKASGVLGFGSQMRLNLITIVANVIRLHSDDMISGATELEISEDELAYLKSRDWDKEDVRLWAHILSNENTQLAAKSIRTGSIADDSVIRFTKRRVVPMPIILAFLRRRNIDSQALRDVLIAVWTKAHTQSDSCSRLLSHSWFIMVVRLLRSARNAWPEALVTIAALFIKTIGLSRGEDHYRPIRLQRITRLSNKVLGLLAIPSSSLPMAAVPFYERAQFDILGWMAEHDPPLTITREGYLAVISIQLAHKKTPRDRDWSRLKVRSWPPWKEDKTGLDVEKGIDYGRSRALEAIQRAAQAGYGAGRWERSAQIVSGWDTDMSPTIQTRTFLLHRYLSYPRTSTFPWIDKEKRSTSRHAEIPENHLWATRILATRTVQEAWACFLECKDQSVAIDKLVYNAMLTKLLANLIPELDPSESEEEDVRSLEPGDYREVLPTPTSPRETTHTRVAPPSADALAIEMHLDHVPISDKNMALLISKSRTIAIAMTYISWKVDIGMHLDHTEGLSLPQDLSGPLFCGIIQRLCSRPAVRLWKHMETGRRIYKTKVIRECAIFTAARLVRARQERKSQQKALVSILLALRFPRDAVPDLDTISSDGLLAPQSFVARYRFAQELFRDCAVELSPRQLMETGHTYLSLLERAIDSALSIHTSASYQGSYGIRLRHLGIDDLLLTTLNDLQQFIPASALTNTQNSPGHDSLCDSSLDTVRALPRLLSTPDPATLHVIIRILGRLKDYEGILTVFEWIRTHASEVKAAAIEPRNGKVMLKRCVLAARVFFERAWDDQLPQSQGTNVDQCTRLKQVVEETGIYGNWPDEERVFQYMEKGGFLPEQSNDEGN